MLRYQQEQREQCVCVCVSHMCAPACDFKTIESLVRTSRVCTRKCSIIMFFRSVGSHVSVFPRDIGSKTYLHLPLAALAAGLIIPIVMTSYWPGIPRSPPSPCQPCGFHLSPSSWLFQAPDLYSSIPDASSLVFPKMGSRCSLLIFQP